MITESDIRRIFREELALALELYAPKGAPVAPAQIPTPALDAVREMSRREQIDALARNPALAKEMFKRSKSRHAPRTKKAAA